MKPGFEARVGAFLFPRTSDYWLTILRLGMALQVCFYGLGLRHDWQLLYTDRAGFVTRELAETILNVNSPLTPRLGWMITLGAHLQISEEQVVSVIWVLLLIASCCLAVGLFSRVMAVVVWFFYLSSVKSGGFYTYGVDNFTIIGLFYLMIAPLPDKWSLDALLGWNRTVNPRRLGFHRRVLQLHLCLIYFFSGLSKATGPGWWDGTSIWRALVSPPYNLVPADVVYSFHLFLPAAGIFVVFLETTYPLFIWLPRARGFWLGAIVAVHLGIGLAMGLYLFASIMIVLNLAAFATDLIPRRPRAAGAGTFAIDAHPAG